MVYLILADEDNEIKGSLSFDLHISMSAQINYLNSGIAFKHKYISNSYFLGGTEPPVVI